MSKVDELVKVYDDAYENRARLEFPTPEMKRAMHRAGIVAVVEALRDEMASGAAWHAINEILGDAGEKVAEPTVGQRLIKAAKEAAAIARGETTDAAPETCEWTCVANGAEYDVWDVGCDRRRLSTWRVPERCPCCHKPIKFKESKT